MKKAMRKKSTFWSVLDLAEGLHLAHSLSALDRLGILESLQKEHRVEELTAKHRVDSYVLEATLQMLASRTKLIAKRANKYRVTGWYRGPDRFVSLQYIGAYGNNAVQLAQTLRSPSSAGEIVDREQHARAFDQASTWERTSIADLVVKLGLEQPLDLGCGTASMLLRLARRSEPFRGWGIDANPWMCESARKRVAAARLQSRITIFQGDCRNVKSAIPSAVINEVRTLTASGVINEFFAKGFAGAIDWLKGLKALFPGRNMLISDYYSQVGSRRRSINRAVTLHDFIQVISGQGVPPPNLKGWREIYHAANCQLVQVHETTSVFDFIHLIKL